MHSGLDKNYFKPFSLATFAIFIARALYLSFCDKFREERILFQFFKNFEKFEH